MKKIKNACLKLEPKRKVPRKTKDSTRIVLPDGLHVILPDANGDAIGMQDTDTSGVAIAMAGRTAKVVSYGVAYAPDGGSTEAGAGGVAVSHNGNADAGDGAVACTFVGVASAFQWSVAYARQTAAFMQRDGGGGDVIKRLGTSRGWRRGGVRIKFCNQTSRWHRGSSYTDNGYRPRCRFGVGRCGQCGGGVHARQKQKTPTNCGFHWSQAGLLGWCAELGNGTAGIRGAVWPESKCAIPAECENQPV